jgi:hypothetical protein
MKKILFLSLLIAVTISAYAQQKDDSNVVKTKFLDFTARSGQIMSFEDFNKTTFTTIYGTLISNKRIVKRATEQKMFLMFELPSQYSSRTAAIAEEDIKDLLNAITTLQNDANIDINTNSEYMEKYYVTEDNFKIGYYISNKQIKWYIDLDIRLSESTFFIKDINDFMSKIQGIIK